MSIVELIHLLKAAHRKAVASENIRSLRRQYRQQRELAHSTASIAADMLLVCFPVPPEILENYCTERNKLRELDESIEHAIDVEVCSILASMRRNVADEMITFAKVIEDYKSE